MCLKRLEGREQGREGIKTKDKRNCSPPLINISNFSQAVPSQRDASASQIKTKRASPLAENILICTVSLRATGLPKSEASDLYALRV